MSNEFLAGAASWFGLDPERLADATMSTNAQGLTLVFKVKLDADDYLGIADRMRALRGPVDSDEHSTFVQMPTLPTLQQVMRTPVEFMGRPECAELIEKAMAMSKGVRLMVEDELARRSGTCSTCADVDEPAGLLPPHVYLDQREMTGDQRLWILGVHPTDGRVAMPLDQLTAEQYAKYGPKPAAPAAGGD